MVVLLGLVRATTQFDEESDCDLNSDGKSFESKEEDDPSPMGIKFKTMV